MKKLLTLAAIAVLAVALAALVGCSSTPAPTPAATTGSSTSAAPAGGTAVTIAQFAFTPADVTIKVGDTVTWANNDSVGHTVTSDTGAFASPNPIAQGSSYSFKFTKAGTYPYHCSVHPTMTAKVTVQ
jgi:plastocyanin